MTISIYPFPIKEISLSPSGQVALNSCNANWHFNKIWKGWRDDAGLAGEVGKCLHNGYQEWLRTGDRDAAQFAMFCSYPTHLNSDLENDRSLYACWATLDRLITSNEMMEYEIATIKCDDGVERPAIEVPFNFTITGFDMGEWHDQETGEVGEIEIIYRGFIDVILYSVLKNEYGVTDIKTHRRNLRDMKPVYQFDEQCTPYGIVLQNMIGEQFRGMRVGFLSAYVDIMEPRVQFFDFFKTTEDIQNWARGLYLDLEVIRRGLQTGFWRRRPSNCTSFNRPCGNAGICSELGNIDVINMMMPDEKEVHVYEKPWVTVELNLATA